MDDQQDVFISHAGDDKARYIEPLTDALTQKGVTFWMDSIEIAWGDSIASKVNEGLRNSQFVLLCLSKHFMCRPWPESELNAIVAIQNTAGIRRVLPLILNSKEEILARYPLVSGLAYRDYAVGPHAIAEELATLMQRPANAENEIHVIVESVHTGRLCNIVANPRFSIKWLIDKAQAGMGVSDLAKTGAYEPFHVRWVLVDKRAVSIWKKLPRRRQRKLRALVSGQSEPYFCLSTHDRLGNIGVHDSIVFHMYAIEDEDYDPAEEEE